MNTKAFELEDDWSSLAHIEVIADPTGNAEIDNKRPVLGYVMVKQRNHPDPLLKFAGGHKAAGETPDQTAAREIVGETGLDIAAHRFELVDRVWLGKEGKGFVPHWSILYKTRITVSELKKMDPFHPGNEGEDPFFLDTDEFYRQVRDSGILPGHYRRLVQNRLVA